jgi:hypothetical protein
MNDTAKLALGVGTGMVIGKLTSNSTSWWWLLGAAGALFVLNSPGTQSAISSGAQSAYSRIKK